MASEYLLWKARNQEPAPPPRELTKKEKLQNWFYYNKLWLLVGAVLLWILGSMLYNVLGIGKEHPDYTFAYVGKDALPNEVAEELTAILAEFGTDLNRDGKVVIALNQYPQDRSGDMETAMYYNYAADTLLVADITAGDSTFFLTEEPAKVQRSYQIFADLWGNPPAEEDYGIEGKALLWKDCPELAGKTGSAQILNLYIGRRAFYDEKQIEAQGDNNAYWAQITKGATQ